MSRNLRDQFTKKAKAAGFLARSAYKLLEIQQRHKIITPGSHCLDLGCSPGAWLQVACQALGPAHKNGCVIGVDVQEVSVPRQYCDRRVQVLQKDAMQLTIADLRHAKAAAGAESEAPKFNVVLSDMCHSTLGVAAADVARSLHLARCAAGVAIGHAGFEGDDGMGASATLPEEGVLLPDGHLVAKLLQGAGSEDLVRELRPHFKKVSWMQPKATRSASREMFVVALGRKQT
ncbi:hypothetical protein CVIRNUC_002092 [Coccomyxa viridis]|uniref:rRNA methyltransferase 2, mitochondrial n=1 Tax=Coccomyxa viridis TaxID=1274662 RepID=A0AAV1HUZ3_9CHLO|nr:hypothetical protein CVIRNUC_002092 [Coccomyxa viridis]